MRKGVLMHFLSLPSIIIGLLLSLNLMAQPLTVVTEEWDGYTNRNGDGVYWGVVDAVFNKMNVSYKRSLVPWARAEKEIRSGTADVIVGAYFSKDQGIIFPKWHLSVEEDLMAVTQKANKDIWQSKLNQLPVLWIRGYGFEQYFDKGTVFKEVNKTEQGLKVISAQRGLAFIDYSSTIIPEMKKLKADVANLSVVKFKDGNKIYIGFSQAGKAVKYIKAFDEAMNQLVRDGTIEKIYERWNIDPKKFGRNRYGN